MGLVQSFRGLGPGTNGLWPGAYAPVPTNKRCCTCVMEKGDMFYDAPEELEHLVNSCYGLEPETIA